MVRAIPLAILMALGAAPAAMADAVVAARALRPGTVLLPADLRLADGGLTGDFADPADLVGQEARVALYPGRPIARGDVGPPALVERNQPVRLVFRRGALAITAEARALDRAGEGEPVKVMNTESRAIVSGIAVAPGLVEVNAR